MKKKNPSRQEHSRIQLLLWAVMLVIIISMFFGFMEANRKRILLQNESYVKDSAQQRAREIDRVLTDASDQIRVLAYYLGQNLTSPKVTPEMLKSMEEQASFDYIRYVDADGMNISSDGRSNNATDREYYLDGMAGNSGTSVTLKSRITSQTLLNFYSPVYYRGEIIGVLRGVYLAEARGKQLLNATFFGEQASAFLCMRDGTVIAGSSPDLRQDNETGIQGLMINENNMDKDMVDQVMNAFEKGESTSFTYHKGRKVGNGYMVRLSTNDWYLLQTFPAQVTSSIYLDAIRAGIMLEIGLVALFTVYICFILISARRQRRRLMEENRDMDYIIRGMPMLFTQFLLVDLEAGTYRYLRDGKPVFSDLDASGQFRVLQEHILDDVADGTDQTRMRQFLSQDRMRMLSSSLDASIEHQTRQDGSWVRLNAVCVEKQEGVPVKILLAKQNVTAAKREELQRQEALQKAIREAEKANIAKSAFLFNMSHDIRTPMNAIIGFATLAQRRIGDTAATRDYLEKIQSSSRILLGIINDVLDLARIESGKTVLHPEPGDLRSTMQTLEEMFSENMQQGGIRFRQELSVENPNVVFDPLRLSQILINLLSNARKFTHSGGSVECRLRQVGTDGAAAQFCVTISDTGIGISPDFLPHIFDAFERERTSTVAGIQGTGLGLSIVKELVDMMGGTIEVESTVDVGTTFTLHLTFPIAGDHALPAGEPAEQPAPDTRGKRLLLVEDNALNQEIALEILEEAGYLVETANDGSIAVNMVSHSEPGYFHLILMDIQMPTMDGYQATRLIRALPDPALASIPITAMTANAFDEDKQRAMDAGMNAHIAKPLDLTQLLGTITMLLQKYEAPEG